VDSTAPPTLLCIDDDPLLHRVVERLVNEFVQTRYGFDSAVSYDEGLAKLTSSAYAVCLLDFRLDRGTGIDLLRELRRHSIDTPVVIMTVADAEDVDIAAAEAGAADFILKSELSPRLLERTVRYAVTLGATLRRLRAMALTDELTGLLNRRQLHNLLQNEWLRAVRFKRPFALGLADIDYFKHVNDAHGHLVGDEVLRHVGQVLERTLRRLDRVARFGGDEFAILMPETGRGEASIAMERVRTALAQSPYPPPGGGGPLAVTLSIGVSIPLEDAESIEQLIAVADRRLYAAKRAGRDRVCLRD
jgi:diguanylate cyclase (GGDEF)-like protein